MFDVKSILEKYLTPEKLEQVEGFISLIQKIIFTRLDLSIGKYTVSIYKVGTKSKLPMIRIDINEVDKND